MPLCRNPTYLQIGHRELLAAAAGLSAVTSCGRLFWRQAERNEAEVKTPPEVAGNATAGEIMAQEHLIFATRAREQQRQLTPLAERKREFLAEIDVDHEKSIALDRNLTRRSDLERAVAALQSNSLDQVTAAMHAGQNVSEATRSQLSLPDRRQTEIANDLQDTQANLEKLRVKEDLVQTLVLTGTSMLTDRSHSLADPTCTVRRSSDGPSEFEATEATVLNPGDVAEVACARSRRKSGTSRKSDPIEPTLPGSRVSAAVLEQLQ